MSPTKMSKKNKPYFNLELESQVQVHHAVCFSPGKKQLFQEVLENKEGVEMKKIKYGEDSETILFGEFSSVKKKEPVSYTHLTLPTIHLV